jgi:hypothetical protein
MFSCEQIQSNLNLNKKTFGKSAIDSRPLWETTQVTWDDALTAGRDHSCPVIKKVVNSGKSALEIWRSYQGKNNAYCEISNLLLDAGRPDLYSKWTHGELRKKTEQTHSEVKPTFQYPEGHNQRILLANARLDQYCVSDHFKTLNHIAHGAIVDYAKSKEEQNKYSVTISDYQSCATKAINLDHFTALVAVKTAQILKGRGVDNQTIANLLSLNFAQTGSVREYGQQQHASKIVSLIIKEIKESGVLPNLASRFRQLARPKIEKQYFGTKNSKLM